MKKLLLFIVLLPTFLLAQPGLGLDSLNLGILSEVFSVKITL